MKARNSASPKTNGRSLSLPRIPMPILPIRTAFATTAIRPKRNGNERRGCNPAWWSPSALANVALRKGDMSQLAENIEQLTKLEPRTRGLRLPRHSFLQAG